MPGQQRADALTLIAIDHDKGDLGFAGPGHDIARAADDCGPAVLVDDGDQRDMIDEIDVHEERLFLLRKSALGYEEAALQRLCAGATDGGEHAGFIVRPQRADFDRPIVTQSLLRGIGGGRHYRSLRARPLPGEMTQMTFASLDLDQAWRRRLAGTLMLV